MRKERHLIGPLELAVGSTQCCLVGRAIVGATDCCPRDLGAGVLRKRVAQPGPHALALDAEGVAIVEHRLRMPLERACSLHRVPSGSSNHRDSIADRISVEHPRHRQSSIARETDDPASNARRSAKDGVEHPRQLHIDAEHRGPGDFAAGVFAGDLMSDQLVHRRILEPQIGGHGLRRGGLRQGAEPQAPRRRRMQNARRRRDTLTGGDRPTRCRCSDEHRPCARPCFAHHIAVAADRIAAGGTMTASRWMTEGLIAARQVDHDLRPIRVEFLGEDLGETVMGPLPHLRLWPGNVHHAVRCDR